MSEPIDLLLVAGEASGDLHGARLLQELEAILPGVRAFGLGGDELAAAGMEALAHSREIAVVGIFEVARILRRARQIFDQLLAEVDRRGARHAVLVDFPDFNLRLAKKLHRRGVRVTYYISPQVWAWRRGRVRTIARDVDQMLVLFPFEVEFYARHGVEAVLVGHPLVDEVPRLGQVWEQGPPADGAWTLGLLPGSRNSEVEALLPHLLAAARIVVDRHPAATVRLIQAPTVDAGLVDRLLAEAEVPVERVERDRFAAIAGCHLAFCASGTATLEVGLLGTPMLLVYRLSAWTYRLARRLVDLPHVGLVNLVLGSGVVPELIQQDAEPAILARRALDLLDHPDRLVAMRKELAGLRARLGSSGASRRAAQAVARDLGAEVTA